ncbi:hypothetical protein LJR289_002095 [Pseudoduganella sp. LjRoot289]|uniref:hypothetical protein n=1 Tax=Pseudoduganella sp. LjRoot289 TaxID=3342314 RepID=UPI003ECF5300
MIVIRQAQLDALASDRNSNFRVLLTDALASAAGKHSDVAMSSFVSRIISDSGMFGLFTENQIVRFGTITAGRFGPDPAYRIPKAALAILTVYGQDPATKLDRYQSWAAGAQAGDTHAAIL